MNSKDNHLTDEFLKEIWCDAFARRGRAWLRVTTGSMEPLINPGEMILIEKTEPQSIVFGDIILFQVHDIFVAHRVLKKYVKDGRFYFLQKGDKGGYAMEVPEDWITGRVTAIEKASGRLIELDKGYGRFIGTSFAILSCLQFYFYERLQVRLKSKTDIKYAKSIYSFFKKLHTLLYRGIATVLVNSILIRKKNETFK